MNKITLLIATAIIAGLTSVSCQPEITIGNQIDENAYDNINSVSGGIFDGETGKKEIVLEIRQKAQDISVDFRLNRAPMMGVDVDITYDAGYLDRFNQIHGTSFELYPEENISIGDNGKIVVAPDEKKSYSVDLSIKPDSELEEGKTYILPLKASSKTEGITITEESAHVVYMVQNYSNQSDCFKGEDLPKTFLYYGANPLNLQEFVLEDGKLFFDVITIFAANINYNAEKGNIYINLNPNLTHLFANNETYFQPLRRRGVKILLGLLGNHDESGLAQLSDLGCAEFAEQIADFVYAYNLDGVNFDDEYSKSPDLSNPLFAPASTERAARLCYETKLRMPDKLVTVYDWGAMYGVSEVEGVGAENWIDIVVADYGRIAYPLAKMTLKNCSGASTELVLHRGPSDEGSARRVKEDGYGYHMMFDLYKGESSNFNWQIQTLKNIARGLYDRELQDPVNFYPEQTFEPIPNPYL